MPSAFTHAAAAIGIGAWFYRRDVPKRIWIAGTIAAIAPDVDAIGYWAGVPYDSLFGHRGITHSLFAAAVGSAILTAAFRKHAGSITPGKLAAYFFLVIASHGFLDAFTDGGGGIAFFSPFLLHRYHFPFRPIAVAPISITRFFTQRGLHVFGTELIWVWIPAALTAALAIIVRRRDLMERRLSVHTEGSP